MYAEINDRPIDFSSVLKMGKAEREEAIKKLNDEIMKGKAQKSERGLLVHAGVTGKKTLTTE